MCHSVIEWQLLCFQPIWVEFGLPRLSAGGTKGLGGVSGTKSGAQGQWKVQSAYWTIWIEYIRWIHIIDELLVANGGNGVGEVEKATYGVRLLNFIQKLWQWHVKFLVSRRNIRPRIRFAGSGEEDSVGGTGQDRPRVGHSQALEEVIPAPFL